ncbi:MAG TPA: class II glutamine amidotransferase, partial [Mycobacterium sp.]
DGNRMLATTWGDTLSILRRPGGVVLASEPYDDNPDWQEIPDRHLVVAEASRVELIPLKGSS